MIAVVETLYVWVGVVSGLLSSFVVLGAILRWTYRHTVTEIVDEVLVRLSKIERQVTPNGGHSDTIGDRVTRIEEHLRGDRSC